MSNKFIEIAGKKIGVTRPSYIISEISANHRHDLDVALKIIEESANAGADAIKIQTLTPDTMTINSSSKDFIVNDGTLWDGRKLYDLYSETPLPYEWHKPIFDKCSELGIACFSTPYDISALEFLDQFDMPAIKIASFEIQDIPLITEAAKRQKPMILSTGISELVDIQRAVSACHSAGNDKIILLKCTSAYPAPYSSMNLLTIPNLRDTFECVAGLSDHSLGIEIPIAAVSLGASVIEKHVTLDRSLGGPDSEFSLEPDELCMMVNSIRNVEAAIGKIDYSISEQTLLNRKRFGRSLYFVRELRKGEVITAEHIRSIRPGFGLHPRHFERVIGMKAATNIPEATAVSWELINAE